VQSECEDSFVERASGLAIGALREAFGVRANGDQPRRDRKESATPAGTGRR
jgi:hypothetical protein